MKRSLFWPIAGFALLTLVLGTVTQLWLVDRVIIPLETRESKARAEVVVATLAGELAAVPRPTAATLDTLMAHHRSNMGQRPAWLAFHRPDGTVEAMPKSRTETIASWFAGTPGPDGRRDRLDILARHAVDGGGEVLALRPVRMRDPIGGSRLQIFSCVGSGAFTTVTPDGAG